MSIAVPRDLEPINGFIRSISPRIELASEVHFAIERRVGKIIDGTGIEYTKDALKERGIEFPEGRPPAISIVVLSPQRFVRQPGNLAFKERIELLHEVQNLWAQLNEAIELDNQPEAPPVEEHQPTLRSGRKIILINDKIDDEGPLPLLKKKVWEIPEKMSEKLRDILEGSLILTASSGRVHPANGFQGQSLPFDFIASLKALHCFLTGTDHSGHLRTGAVRTVHPEFGPSEISKPNGIIVAVSGLDSADDEKLAREIGENAFDQIGVTPQDFWPTGEIVPASMLSLPDLRP